MSPETAAGLDFRIGASSDALCVGVVGAQAWCDGFARDGITPTLAREVVEYFSTQAMADELSSPNSVFILAEKHGRLIGFAQLDLASRSPWVPTENAMELHRLYVLRSHSRSGVGTALLMAAEAAARARGAHSMWLTIWVDNQPALAFFRHMAFTEFGARKYSFEGQEYENCLMKRGLMV